MFNDAKAAKVREEEYLYKYKIMITLSKYNPRSIVMSTDSAMSRAEEFANTGTKPGFLLPASETVLSFAFRRDSRHDSGR